jgi:hypothetical protein
LSANISKNDRKGIDMIIHKDPKKEYGNKTPTKADDFLFKLKENECVISYLQDQKEKFYKLLLTKEKDAYYP